MRTFVTTAPIAAHLDIPAGRIRLVAGDRTDTTSVKVLPANAAERRDIAAAERIQVGYGDGVLRVEAPEAGNRLFGDSGSVEVVVHLPAGSTVEGRAAAADLRGTGRLGDVVFEAARATVELEETGSARLALQEGDITLGRLGGPARITTRKGDLTVAEATRGTVVLRTEHGDITVGAARGTSAALDAGTAYGRIHNALRNTDGTAAALTVQATTAYGDVTARTI
ncbi:DUF4097 family beta strand repeat-containing protein [Streptomyces sp. NPDC006339]|uniref:DUF4097 family beta strand repeat-containing protein n=1 Tax=Streptomyces sp. NPDC006339 TaxID=3156755 RepID=UPI0033BCB526